MPSGSVPVAMVPDRSAHPSHVLPEPGPLRAWLFDLYPRGPEMVLWFLTESGARVRATEVFEPVFHVALPFGRVAARAASRDPDDPLDPASRFRSEADRLPGLAWAGPVERIDFWTGRPRAVAAVRVTDMDRGPGSLARLFQRHPDLEYFDCDIAPEIHYAYDRNLFPSARCEFVATDAGRLVSCRPLEDPFDTEHRMPPLRMAELRADASRAGRAPVLRSLSLVAEGRELVWDDAAPRDMLLSLADALRAADPDVLWTRGGDSMLLPALLDLAARHRVELPLDREPGVARRLRTEGRTYMSYGRVLYHAPDHPLFGRWHIDAENSFWSAETGLEGLLEVARLSKIPVQRAARRSIGTGISSIQLDHAWRHGILIPWKKSRPESWKSAARLVAADRGGLVYQPIPGVYEDVVELDFVSMYPTIMIRCNVSPETIDCACCEPEPVVPDIGYSICRRRRGLVSTVLEPLVAKRRRYKAAMKAMGPAPADPEVAERRAALDGRQGAIKWLLVCCFGYLGYRNARFGRIEAHESTCAFSREKLLLAKEAAEERGFETLHAIVDCLWLRRPARPADDDEIAALCREIEAATDLDIAVEGRYRWIVFLPSRRDPTSPVPARYFGRMADGKLKFRGIELRRSDQPPCARDVQERLLDRMREAESVAAILEMRDELLGVAREAMERLRRREVPFDRLVMRRATSKEAEDYESPGMTAVAARATRAAGLPLHAGEAVRFVVLNEKDRDPASRLRPAETLRPEDAYDGEFYAERVRRAAATLLEPFFGEDCLPRPSRPTTRASTKASSPTTSKPRRAKRSDAPTFPFPPDEPGEGRG